MCELLYMSLHISQMRRRLDYWNCLKRKSKFCEGISSKRGIPQHGCLLRWRITVVTYSIKLGFVGFRLPSLIIISHRGRRKVLQIRKTNQTSSSYTTSEVKLYSRIILPCSAKASDPAAYVADVDCNIVLSSFCGGPGLTSPLAPIAHVSRFHCASRSYQNTGQPINFRWFPLPVPLVMNLDANWAAFGVLGYVCDTKFEVEEIWPWVCHVRTRTALEVLNDISGVFGPILWPWSSVRRKFEEIV
jgi:hypothetical protein